MFVLERPTDDLFDIRAPLAMTSTTVQIPNGLLIQLNVHTHVPNYTHRRGRVSYEQSQCFRHGRRLLVEDPADPMRTTPGVLSSDRISDTSEPEYCEQIGKGIGSVLDRDHFTNRE